MTKETDFLVIGSGIAGLSYALKVAEQGKVILISKTNLEESNTKYAQGGIAAVTYEPDDFQKHVEDTIGAGAEGANKIYLRPETAQGIFVNYLNVQKTGRMKIPFGIAQIGKAFRNEIVARQFIFRMREFEQMEMQFFVKPGTEMEWFDHWKEMRINWHKAMGLPEEKYRFHKHDKLAHYANAAYDIEFEFPFGFKELEGIHSRTDFDLSQHQKFSGKKIQYYDHESGESYVPFQVSHLF